jgi:hypothetical protein
MSKMAIYDPAMCCSTGVCGPSVDPELLRIAAVVENLKKSGMDVERYNLSSEPQAFVQSEAVSDALNKGGADALPITMVDGKIVRTGSYPSNEELSGLLGVKIEDVQARAADVKANKCGCGPDCCC